MPYHGHEEEGIGSATEQERHVLIARGEINPQDRRLASAFLRRFGLEVESCKRALQRLWQAC